MEAPEQGGGGAPAATPPSDDATSQETANVKPQQKNVSKFIIWCRDNCCSRGRSSSTESGMEAPGKEGGAGVAMEAPGEETVNAKPKEDVSKFITHKDEDLGVKQYKIMLHFKDVYVRLTKDDHVNCSLSGTNQHHLMVTVGDRIYHSEDLMGGVKHYEVKKKKLKDMDLITVILDKKEPKMWLPLQHTN